MKKIYFSILLFTGCLCLNAQWNYVGGGPGVSAGSADYNSIAIDKNGNLYVAYQDIANGGQFSVKTFNDTGWAYVGSSSWSQNGGQAYQVRLALDSTGTPYVFCTDNNFGVVRKFTAGNWAFVGDSQFTAVQPDYLDMTIAPNGTPYVVFSDFDSNEMVTVMKFDGHQWDTVGNTFETNDMALYDGIATDANSTPYIVFSDNSQQLKATAMKFNGTGWDTLGQRGFTTHEADYTSIAIDHNGVPYVAFVDSSTGQANVMKYSGGSWASAGNANFSAPLITGITIAIDNNNVPYVAFEDTDGHQATVMSLTGSAWGYVGTPDFTSAEAPYLSLAISPTTNIPYVAYTDGGNNDVASVMGYGSTLGIDELANDMQVQLYPNPVSNLIHLTTTGFTAETINILDLRGQQVMTGKYAPQLNVTNLTSGVYFVELKGENGVGVVRFEKM